MATFPPASNRFCLILTTVTIGLGWLAILLGGVAAMLWVPAIVCAVGLLAISAKPVQVALCVVLSPVVIMATVATIDYTSGRGTLRSFGLPGAESFNADRQTRLPRSGGSCLVDGSEWLYIDLYNSVLRAWVSTRGPMAGSYAGPYPTREDAEEQLALAGKPLDMRDLFTGRFELAGQRYRLPAGRMEHFVESTAGTPADDYDQLLEFASHLGDPWVADAAVVEQRCLVLAIPQPNPRYGPEGKQGEPVPHGIVLIDLETGWPFARYGQHFYSRIPIVWWRRDLWADLE